MLTEVSEEHVNVINVAFAELKSVCDVIVKNPSAENCSEFVKVVEKTPSIAFKYLLEYSVFPLHLHLHNHIFKKVKLSSNTLIDLLKCFKKVLSKTCLNSDTKFLEYSIVLLRIVLDFEEHEIIKDISEDVKYEVAECLMYLYKNIDDALLCKIYDPFERRYCHPQAVYFCTQVAKTEKLLKLRVLALKCLLVIARIDGEEYFSISDETLRYNVLETIALMFPGIISACHMVITSDSLIHHNLFIVAIKVFSRIVTLIFENNSNQSISEIDFGSKVTALVSKTKVPEEKSTSKTSRLTEEWYEEATQKLSTCTKGFIPVCANLHCKVRLELVKSADLMLTKCSKNIKMFSTTLVEILIIMSCDNMNEVSNCARRSLKKLLDQDTESSQQIMEFLEENLCVLLDSIISSLNAIDEKALLSNLNLLNGYLNILNMRHVLKSSYHLQRLVNTLIQTVRLDPSSLNSFHEFRIQELEVSNADGVATISWKNSKHLNCQTEIALKNVCKTLSCKIDFESMTFYLLDIFETNIEDRKEVIYLMNNVLLSGKQEYCKTYFDIMSTILKYFLDSVYWSVPINSSSDGFFDFMPLSAIHSNIMQVCLLTEGVGNVAECLQTKFHPLLLICLYSIIENAGSSNPLISSAGLEAIRKITSSCGYSNITELITDNVDYVIHHVASKLRDLKRNKKVFDVLDVIILHCEEQSLNVLCDITETMLKSSDILSDEFREGFLKVFKRFIRKLRKWFAPLFNDDMRALNESNEKHSQFLVTLDQHVNKKNHRSVLPQRVKDEEINLNDIFITADLDYSEPEDDEDISNEDILREKLSQMEIPEDEIEKPVPQHIQLIVSVANRLLHVLPTKCVMDKILILEILMDTLLILCDIENQLLPLVHKIWSPLMNRFKYDNEDSLVLRRCFELICIMAVTARDFIRTRTLNEILPILNNFLSSSSIDSKLKDRKSIYRMSQKYKLQHTLLRELGHLSMYICLQEKELYTVLAVASLYLSSKQPQPLQLAAIDLFKTIASTHYEIVWVQLMSLHLFQTVLYPPNNDRFDIIRVMEKEENDEFEKNVSSLYNLI
ncbi:TELO2-interacting protein 1 homolog [Planococcus citri]|uniref:TELO2-interacting protein 1 homolog n=1 Tax=Planococcus citri TaxID=170843 RepID=UPI0031F7D6F9